MAHNDHNFMQFHCEIIEIACQKGCNTRIPINEGYLIPLQQPAGVHFFVGQGMEVQQDHPWMDTWTYPWSFSSEEADVTLQFIRITVNA